MSLEALTAVVVVSSSVTARGHPRRAAADPDPETDAPDDDPGADADERERRGRAGAVVDEEADDQAGDDGSGEEAPEPHEVTTPQAVVGVLIDHSPKSLSSAGLKAPARRPIWARSSTSDDGAKLPQRDWPANPGTRGRPGLPSGVLRGALLQSAVVMVGGRSVWGVWRCL